MAINKGMRTGKGLKLLITAQNRTNHQGAILGVRWNGRGMADAIAPLAAAV